MKNIISRFKFFIAMLIFWFLLNFNFELTTIVFGIVISLVVSLFAYEVLHDDKGFRFKGVKLHRLVFYLLMLFIEIFRSAILYIINLFKRTYVPVVFKITLDKLDPMKVAIVANSITLTPGTITIDIVNHTIYVMVLADPSTPHEVLEKPIRERFEKLLLQKEKKHDNT